MYTHLTSYFDQLSLSFQSSLYYIYTVFLTITQRYIKLVNLLLKKKVLRLFSSKLKTKKKCDSDWKINIWTRLYIFKLFSVLLQSFFFLIQLPLPINSCHFISTFVLSEIQEISASTRRQAWGTGAKADSSKLVSLIYSFRYKMYLKLWFPILESLGCVLWFMSAVSLVTLCHSAPPFFQVFFKDGIKSAFSLKKKKIFFSLTF